jgi:hypothetical protein
MTVTGIREARARRFMPLIQYWALVSKAVSLWKLSVAEFDEVIHAFQPNFQFLTIGRLRHGAKYRASNRDTQRVRFY